MKTYVVGHKNPDTDSVVAAIALSVLRSNSVAAVSGTINNETKYLLESFGYDTPALLPAEKKSVILVDNNGNPDELADGLLESEIVAVYDHHKLGGLKTVEPVEVYIRPVGSTATVLFDLYANDLGKIDTRLASLMIGAILSDTLNFTSPTTTEDDRNAAERLNEIATLDIPELAEGLFAAKSDVSMLSDAELIGKDYKVFEFHGKKVGVGVWETVLPQTIRDRKIGILKELENKKTAEALDFILFAVVDIVNGNSEFILCGKKEEELTVGTFGGSVIDSVLLCPGIVSRKKQVVPQLENYLAL
jgi:manganese-dependent inorganic pyrophosphatase